MKFPIKKLSLLELILTLLCLAILIVLIPIEINNKNFTQDYPVIISIITGIASGILTAIALLYFQERHYEKKLKEYYTNIEGEYIRIEIGQDNTLDVNLQNITNENLGLSVVLTYQGGHRFKVIAKYWKSSDATVEAIIEFNETDGMSGNGRYLYKSGGSGFMGHFGTYTIYKYEEDNTKLLVLFQHIFPRKIEYNPDNNRGWEIWQKKK